MNYLRVVEREGLEEFATTLAFQQNLVRARIEDRSLADTLVFVEHDHVYTVGRGVPKEDPLTPDGTEVKWFEISRGGKATYHGPGQLVAYPIFDLSFRERDVHVYLRQLEEAVIRCLKEVGITGCRREGLTGVWVAAGDGWKKIASIGVGVRRWITYHGLALNVTTDLRYLHAISACGFDGTMMTSMEEVYKERGESAPTMVEVKKALVAGFCSVFQYALPETNDTELKRRPQWLKVQAPGSPQFLDTKDIIKSLRLVTVCEEARCPNIGECWSNRTATFMIMGELCTRRCGFCSVKDGTLDSLQPLDPFEPLRIAKAIEELGLKHVVITSVNRDDLEDMGAAHFLATAKAIRHSVPDCKIEFLIPDMRGTRKLVEIVITGGHVDVLNHNVETIPRLYRSVRPGAVFQRSLDILKWAKEIQPNVRTKSGIMLGLGEQVHEVLYLMDNLRSVDCDIMTIGQYLQPSSEQLPVERFVPPDEFDYYREEGLKKGFSFVESGAFVRSSYHAWKHVDQPSFRTNLVTRGRRSSEIKSFSTDVG